MSKKRRTAVPFIVRVREDAPSFPAPLLPRIRRQCSRLNRGFSVRLTHPEFIYLDGHGGRKAYVELQEIGSINHLQHDQLVGAWYTLVITTPLSLAVDEQGMWARTASKFYRDNVTGIAEVIPSNAQTKAWLSGKASSSILGFKIRGLPYRSLRQSRKKDPKRKASLIEQYQQLRPVHGYRKAAEILAERFGLQYETVLRYVHSHKPSSFSL